MGKTIRELAEELGVSKTAIRKYMDADFRTAHTETNPANTIVIDDAGCKLIAESLRKPTETTGNKEPETTGNQVSGDIVALLQSTIDTLQRQLAVKDAQIEGLTVALEKTTVSLQAAQALHAGTIQNQLLPEGSEPSKKKWRWPWQKEDI